MNYWQKKYRLWQWIAIALCGIALLAYLSPPQLPVLLVKAINITVAVVMGYWADRLIFYYARPHELAKAAWVETTTHTFKSTRCESAWRTYALAMIRRAIIVAAVIIAFALGL